MNFPIDIYSDEDIKMTAIGVDHYNMPTLAYRVDIGEISIGYGADQTLRTEEFTDFMKGVDVLILHLAVSESAEFPAYLHAIPSIVGVTAQDIGARTLVLSHFIKLDSSKVLASDMSLSDLNANLALVKQEYSGTIILAEDLQCIEVKK